MPRQKKDYSTLCIKVEAGIMRRFNEYCSNVGQTKTLAFERIVTEHMDKYEREKKYVEKIMKESHEK